MIKCDKKQQKNKKPNKTQKNKTSPPPIYKQIEIETNHDKENVTPCYYCGMSAIARDHTIPRIILKSLDSVGINIRGRRKLIVPTCTQCNSLLGASYQKTLEKRKQILKNRLRKKYRKLLAMPDWTEKDLEPMGYSLQTTIISSLIKKEEIKRRLAW